MLSKTRKKYKNIKKGPENSILGSQSMRSWGRGGGLWIRAYHDHFAPIFFIKYKARHAHKRLYTVLPKYSKIQVLPGITSCRLVKDNKQAIELNSLLLNNMPKDGYG